MEAGTRIASLSDAELIAQVRSGDTAAYGELYARHVDAARALARQYAPRQADADDIVSDAFARMLQTLQAGNGPDLFFRAYLFTTVRRIAYRMSEAGQRVQSVDDFSPIDEGVEFDDPAVAGFERQVVRGAFSSLPERWQAALWYTEVEGMAPAEVAPLLGLSPNGVAALAYRAREGLRQAYLQQHLASVTEEACESFSDKLGAYARGGLSRRESAKVEEHLKDCSKCRAMVLELADINHGMQAFIAPMVLGAAGAAALIGAGLAIGGGIAAGAAGAAAGNSTAAGVAGNSGAAGVAGNSAPAGAAGNATTGTAGAGQGGSAASTTASSTSAAGAGGGAAAGTGAAAAAGAAAGSVGIVAAVAASVAVLAVVAGGIWVSNRNNGAPPSDADPPAPTVTAAQASPGAVVPPVSSSPSPSDSPSALPSQDPSPTDEPGASPSDTPSPGTMPVTLPPYPTSRPYPGPTVQPTRTDPTGPSNEPSQEPSSGPSPTMPSTDPTAQPSATPSASPTSEPSVSPSPSPSVSPTPTPTVTPTPTPTPTVTPTPTPTPTVTPTPTPTTPPVKPAVPLSLDMADVTLPAGDSATVTIAATNTAAAAIGQTTVEVALPEGLVFTEPSASPLLALAAQGSMIAPPSCTTAAQLTPGSVVYTCTLGALDPGQTATFSLPVGVSDDVAAGSVAINVTMEADGFTSTSAQLPVTVGPAMSSGLEVDVSAADLTVGHATELTVSYLNVTSMPISLMNTTVSLPYWLQQDGPVGMNGVTLCGSGAGMVACQATDIPAGQAVILTIPVKVLRGDPASHPVQLAVAARGHSLSVSPQLSVQVPKLLLSVEPLTADAKAGSASVEVLVASDVDTVLAAPTLTVTLPPNLRLDTAVSTGAWACQAASGESGQVVTCTAADLATSQADLSLPVSIEPSIVGDGTIRADLRSAEADPVSATSTATITLADHTGNFAFSVVPSVSAGGVGTLQIALINDNDRARTSVTAQITLPKGLTYTGFVGADWTRCAQSGSTVLCSYSQSIARGATSKPLTLNVQADASLAGTTQQVLVWGASTLLSNGILVQVPVQ